MTFLQFFGLVSSKKIDFLEVVKKFLRILQQIRTILLNAILLIPKFYQSHLETKLSCPWFTLSEMYSVSEMSEMYCLQTNWLHLECSINNKNIINTAAAAKWRVGFGVLCDPYLPNLHPGTKHIFQQWILHVRQKLQTSLGFEWGQRVANFFFKERAPNPKSKELHLK